MEDYEFARPSIISKARVDIDVGVARSLCYNVSAHWIAGSSRLTLRIVASCKVDENGCHEPLKALRLCARSVGGVQTCMHASRPEEPHVGGTRVRLDSCAVDLTGGQAIRWSCTSISTKHSRLLAAIWAPRLWKRA